MPPPSPETSMDCFRCLAPTLLSSLVLAAPIAAQLPDGYRLGPGVELPTSLHDATSDGRFTIDSERGDRDSFRQGLIEIAERLFPDDSMFASATAKALARNLDRVAGMKPELQRIDDDIRRRYKALFDSAATIPGDRWWWYASHEPYAPYALTGATIVQYIGVIRNASRQQAFRDFDGRTFHPTARLRYTATVSTLAPGRADGARYLVRLDLLLAIRCGGLCGEGFTHDRDVLFDEEGHPIAIEGDREPSIVVS